MMNREDRQTDDSLREFMGPWNVARAPEGFTRKTMTRIMIEKQARPATGSFLERNRIPLITAGVTAILVASALIIPTGEDSSMLSGLWRYIDKLLSFLPSIGNLSFKGILIPRWVNYAIPVIILLLIFDRGLDAYFNKRHNTGKQ